MSSDMLLHPELMSNEQLISIIYQRHLKIPNIQGMQREELLNLFHQYCLPYGQRKYKETGRGKVLNKNRSINPENQINLNTINSTNAINNSRLTNTNNIYGYERLKPPSDLLSGHMKRIKLDCNIHNEPDKFKRKVPIDPVTKTTDCPPAKKDRKPITWP